MPEAARVASGPGRNRVYADAFRSKLGGEVANGALERGLGYAHDVVVLHDHLAAVVGHREERAAFAHQRFGQVSHADEGPAGHLHGREEAVSRDIDDSALQRILWARRRWSVRRNPGCPIRSAMRSNTASIWPGRANIERHHDRCFKLARKRLDIFPCLVVEIGHGEFGAERPKGFGAAPGDGIFVGNPDDESPLPSRSFALTGGNLRLGDSIPWSSLPCENR